MVLGLQTCFSMSPSSSSLQSLCLDELYDPQCTAKLTRSVSSLCFDWMVEAQQIPRWMQTMAVDELFLRKGSRNFFSYFTSKVWSAYYPYFLEKGLQNLQPKDEDCNNFVRGFYC